jgi:hypothetical protein
MQSKRTFEWRSLIVAHDDHCDPLVEGTKLRESGFLGTIGLKRQVNNLGALTIFIRF